MGFFDRAERERIIIKRMDELEAAAEAEAEAEEREEEDARLAAEEDARLAAEEDANGESQAEAESRLHHTDGQGGVYEPPVGAGSIVDVDEKESDTDGTIPYDGAEVAQGVRAAAKEESVKSLGGRPPAETQVAAAAPEGPRRTFGEHERGVGVEGKTEAQGLGVRRGRQVNQWVQRAWYGLTGQDERQLGVIASQESQDLRGKAVKSGLVKPAQVADTETADALLANAILYLDPSLTTEQKRKQGLVTPMSPTEAKRKEDMARKIIAKARRGGDDSLADAWKHLPEDLRRIVLKLQGFEYDEVSPAERAEAEAEAAAVSSAPKGTVAYDSAPKGTVAYDSAPKGTVAYNTQQIYSSLGETGEKDEVTALALQVAPAMIYLESRGNPQAKNDKTHYYGKPKSASAQGLFQFIDKTWIATLDKHAPKYKHLSNQEKYDLKLSDVNLHARMGLRFTEDNIRALKKMGVPLEPAAVYTAHFLGLGGTRSFYRNLKKNPEGNITEWLSEDGVNNNPGLTMTNGKPHSTEEFRKRVEKVMELRRLQSLGMASSEVTSLDLW